MATIDLTSSDGVEFPGSGRKRIRDANARGKGKARAVVLADDIEIVENPRKRRKYEKSTSGMRSPGTIAGKKRQASYDVLDLTSSFEGSSAGGPGRPLDIDEFEDWSEEVFVVASRKGGGSSSSSSFGSSSSGGGGSSSSSSPDIVMRVLEIFPDALSSYIRSAAKDYRNNFEQLVAHLAETKYPKIETKAPGAGGSSSGDGNNSNATSSDGIITDATFESSVWKPDHIYVTAAIQTLANEFPDLSKRAIEDAFKQGGKRYCVAKQELEKFDKTAAGKASHLKTRRKLQALSYSCPLFDAELVWMRRKAAAEQSKKDAEVAHKIKMEEAAKCGALFECGCCYGESLFEDLVQCEEGHLFCGGCLQRYVQERLYGLGRVDLVCMSGEGCKAKFSDEFLQRALPEAVFSKYQQKSAEVAISAVIGDALFSCPSCGSQAMLPPTQQVFTCPNVSCRIETCRHCQEPSHIPLKCNEVEKKVETSSRKTVEEAMSKAKIRTCPKCKASFVKESGCNKMSCACGALVCYICRAHIAASVGYNHFCRTPHCQHKDQCRKCPLFTNDAQDDEMAMKEAGQQAKLQAEKDGIKLDKVDIGSLLEKASAQRPIPGMPIGYMPGMPYPHGMPVHAHMMLAHPHPPPHGHAMHAQALAQARAQALAQAQAREREALAQARALAQERAMQQAHQIHALLGGARGRRIPRGP